MDHCRFTLPLLALCAAAVPAQHDAAARELAAVIAVEDQERDLAKAERLYREALTGTTLSPAARELATTRLAALLRRLGRGQEAAALQPAATANLTADASGGEAPGQDADRARALRLKAEELVAQALADLPDRLRLQSQSLIWLGQAAVPACIGGLETLERRWPSAPPDNAGHLASTLAKALWTIGGPAASAALADRSKHPNESWRLRLVESIERPPTTDAVAAAAVAFLGDPSDNVFFNVIHKGLTWSGPLADAATLIRASSSKRRAAWMTKAGTALTDSRVSHLAPGMPAVLAMVMEGLHSADPDLEPAAWKLLCSKFVQTDVAGIELLLHELPNLPPEQAPPALPWATEQTATAGPQRPPAAPGPRPQVAGPSWPAFSYAQAERLAPQLTACLKLPNVDRSRTDIYCAGLASALALGLAERAVPHLLTWIELGLPIVSLLQGRIDGDQVPAVFELFDRADGEAAIELHQVLQDFDLPAELAPRYLRKAAILLAANPTRPFASRAIYYAARTGHADAAAWIVSHAKLLNPSPGLDALLQLARRNRDPKVCDALRGLVELETSSSVTADVALLALIAMHDAKALPLVVSAARRVAGAHPHPFVAAEAPLLSPFHYLVENHPAAPHSFSVDEVLPLLATIAARSIPTDWRPERWSVDSIPDALLAEFARLTTGKLNDGNGWLGLVQQRLHDRRLHQQDASVLTAWNQRILTGENFALLRHLVDYLRDEDCVALQTTLERLLDHEDSDVARSAAYRLELTVGRNGTEWEQRLLANRHEQLRLHGLALVADRRDAATVARILPFAADPADSVRKEVALHCAALLSADSVPTLLLLLRDPVDRVRDAAADALNRIRFHHEQVAHWQRVLQGLDASPASAAEKLLLQARPGAPQEQRLLAIRSLGLLGAPEALPFLIEWAQDVDAAVAAAAKAAVLEIHTKPRR